MSYQFADALSLSMQPMFVRRGTHWGENNLNTRIDYLDLPLLLRFDAAEKLFAEAGGYVGFRLHSRVFRDGEYLEDYQKSLDVLHRDIDAGGIVGIGYRVGDRGSMSLRYCHSFIALYENIIFTDRNGDPLGDQPKLLQQSVQLLLAYYL